MYVFHKQHKDTTVFMNNNSSTTND
ncbi:hypothetical protein PPL_09710 [Heterostelium album PN500]|uniref:Uncharacterized protein n=1 Tax=Heterostelium pallidum (strain ATCC 26659 / Pp 5 / PN500) TaxID=670386 RepID=D3BNK7_HETP5|nr:hypothetical protein PPL_09710 [Heterostelium album PN500]